MKTTPSPPPVDAGGSVDLAEDSTLTRLRVKQLFEAALDLEETERAAYLAAELTREPRLRREVEELFSAYGATEDFLETPALDAWAKVWRVAEPGDRLGPYEVLRVLGKGGMGTVFLAVRADDEYRKLVAIKLAGSAAPGEVLERLRAERQILAELEHPNIAHLLDGGTTDDGQPYLVMEYVDGDPVDVYCDRHSLSVDRRIDLMLGICDAVQLAHRNLVVHRDLKPRNILITRDGEPKLLDFGIAKLLEVGAEAADVTRIEQRVFTPSCASPEQFRGQPVTTATDVYALGVLLHRLLTGRPPRTFDSLTPVAVEGVLAKTVPPPGLGRDLDTIVLKALEVDPLRRYGSVEQLADDLRRHRDGLPILARPQTLGYRASRFVGRHRLGVAVGAAVLLLSAGFGIDRASQARALAMERDRAVVGEAHARELATFLEDLLRRSNPWQEPGREVTVREALDQGASAIGDRFGDQPLLRARLLDSMGRIYVGLGRLDEAEPLLEGALEHRRGALAGDHPEVAESLLRLGNLRYRQARYDVAETLMAEAKAILEGSGGEPRRLAEAWHHLGQVAFLQGRLELSEERYREALRRRIEALGDDHPEVADTQSQLAMTLVEVRRLDEAESLLRQSLATVDRHLGPGDPASMVVRGNLASLLRRKGDLAGAEVLFRRVLAERRPVFGDGHIQVGRALNNLAAVLAEQGKLDEAEVLYLETLGIARDAYGEIHRDVAVVHQALGRVKLRQGDLSAAGPHLRRSVDIVRQVLPPGHPGAAYGLLGLGQVELGLGRAEQALPLFQEALDLRRGGLPPGHPEIAQAERLLADCLLALGRVEEGEGILLAGVGGPPGGDP
ncbi:MAG: serine/threonine-protein kinase [Acidobacteriota bacterium]